MPVARVARFLLAAAVTVAAPACRRSAMPPRPDGAAVVFASDALGAAGDVSLAPEAEPNDTLATAQRLVFGAGDVLGVSASLHAVENKSRDTDLYRVDVVADGPAAPPPPAGADGGTTAGPARRSLRLDVGPEATLAVSVEALDDQGQPLAVTGAGQAGESLAIPNLAVTPGTYYFRVRSAVPTGAGAYRLVAKLSALEAGGELEPNGKAGTATELGATGEAVGSYGWRHDQDWYRVPLVGLAEGSVLSADLEPAPGVTASLLVFDSVEQKLTEARGRKEERVALRSVRVPAGEPYLYVVVRADAGWNGEVRYNLRLRAELPKAGGEAEPNDDPAHAQAIADTAGTGPASLAGYLGRGDVDVFRYTSPVPVELDVEVTPPERVDVKLEVLRPDGTPLARADSGKRREPERLPNVFAPTGAALIRLSAGKGDGNPDEPYHLTITARPPEPGAEHEPDDTIATPTPLAASAVGSGLIAPRGDVDFWQVAAPADPDGNVTVSVGGVPGLTLDVRVRASAGRELGRFKVAPGAAPAANRVPAGGEPCCLVEVREATGHATNPRDRYSLAVGK
jgi:hypothetical protein